MLDPNIDYFECNYIGDICPYGHDCEDCHVWQAVDEAKELAKYMRETTPEQEYDEYHADDYKRLLEERLILGDDMGEGVRYG